jgi:rhodanese-related sulfurtransferase
MPPQFSIPLSRLESTPRYWSAAASLAGILILSLLLGTLAQFLRPVPVPWFEDHSQSSLAKAQPAGVDVVSLEQAQDLVFAGQVLVLDARSLGDFDAGHLPGAVSFPNATRSEAFYELAALLQPEQSLLVYCSRKTCDDALQLALFLREQGSKKIHVFAEGFQAWREAGLPTE